ncbi:MAG: EpsG family protein [Butyrivibrio sp.]|nr:EpsG family protein [Butyrivibrio sp.]
MLYLIGAALVFLSVLKPSNKKLFILISLYIIFVFGFNTSNPDYGAYRLAYMNPYRQVTSIKEPLFLFVCRLFYKLSFGYIWFRLILAIVTVAILQYCIFKLSPYPNMVSVLFVTYPFALCVVQIRSFVSLSIVVMGITYYLEQRDKKKSAVVWLLLFIIIAAMFHYSAIIYCVLCISACRKTSHRLFLLAVITILWGIVIDNAKGIIEIAKKFVDETKINRYVSSPFQGGFFRSISLDLAFYTIFIRLIVVGVCVVYMLSRRDRPTEKAEYKFLDDNNVIFRMLLYTTIVSLALELGVSTTYSRISRLPLILAYILLSRYIYRSNENKAALWLTVFIYTFVYAYISFTTQKTVLMGEEMNQFNGVFRAIFENNLVLKYVRG